MHWGVVLEPVPPPAGIQWQLFLREGNRERAVRAALRGPIGRFDGAAGWCQLHNVQCPANEKPNASTKERSLMRAPSAVLTAVKLFDRPEVFQEIQVAVGDSAEQKGDETTGK